MDSTDVPLSYLYPPGGHCNWGHFSATLGKTLAANGQPARVSLNGLREASVEALDETEQPLYRPEGGQGTRPRSTGTVSGARMLWGIRLEPLVGGSNVKDCYKFDLWLGNIG